MDGDGGSNKKSDHFAAATNYPNNTDEILQTKSIESLSATDGNNYAVQSAIENSLVDQNMLNAHKSNLNNEYKVKSDCRLKLDNYKNRY